MQCEVIRCCSGLSVSRSSSEIRCHRCSPFELAAHQVTSGVWTIGYPCMNTCLFTITISFCYIIIYYIIIIKLWKPRTCLSRQNTNDDDKILRCSSRVHCDSESLFNGSVNSERPKGLIFQESPAPMACGICMRPAIYRLDAQRLESTITCHMSTL